MSVLYEACDAYRCDDTCQHFILVTGLFILLPVKSLTLVEKANKIYFCSRQEYFKFIPVSFFMIYHLFDVPVVSGASVLLHVALLLTVISSGRPVPVTCH